MTNVNTTTIIDRKYDKSKDVSIKGFVSPNKYRKDIDELVELEKEIEDLEKEIYPDTVNKEQIQEPVVPDNKDEKLTPEEANWKKRYGDLRRYLSQKDTQVKELEKKIGDLEKQPVKYPTEDKEIQEWIEKYPDVANIVKTIAMKENEVTKEEIKKELEDLKAQKLRIDQQKAFNQLLELQPDFEKIIADPKFVEYDEDRRLIGGWLFEQPESLQLALFKPSFDEKGVKSASRVIDLYKIEAGVVKTKTTTSSKDRLNAAQAVTKGSERTPQTETNKTKFSESMVEKMSQREYERLEPQIKEAMREGSFEYDLTGGAR